MITFEKIIQNLQLSYFLRKKIVVFIQGDFSNITAQNVLIIQSVDMNNIKIKVYMNVIKEICEKYNGEEEFNNDRIEEICSHEKLSVEEVIYFLLAFFKIKG